MIAPLAALIRYHELKTDNSEKTSYNKREEARLLASMSDDLKNRYEMAVRRYGAKAVVPLERGICRGCFMRQPAILPEIEEDVHACQNCGRLLYDPDVAYELSVG